MECGEGAPDREVLANPRGTGRHKGDNGTDPLAIVLTAP